LKSKKKWVDGVVLTGGEPLFSESEVFDITKKIKEIKLDVKIDTNGAYPHILKNLIKQKLIDYVAMDIKAPIDERYFIAAGRKFDLKDIRQSIQILFSNAIDYEFRTTCVPGIINEETISEIGNVIKDAKKWALQRFIPEQAHKQEYRKKLDANYELSLQKYLAIAKKYVLNTILR
jgi:pyruvate formate lyase activating enzyme